MYKNNIYILKITYILIGLKNTILQHKSLFIYFHYSSCYPYNTQGQKITFEYCDIIYVVKQQF